MLTVSSEDMVQTNHNKVETAEGHTALLRAVKSRLLPMVSSKTFPTISRYAAVSVILHSVHDSGYATCWSWRRCWCHWWRWQQFPAHCHKVNCIGTVALHCIVVISLVRPVLSPWFDLVFTGLEVDVWWKHSSSENLQITISSTGYNYSPSNQ